jgi:C-terminal processing protease CtpA/Prc
MSGKHFLLPLFVALAVVSIAKDDQPIVMAPMAVTAGPLGYLGITFDLDVDAGFFSHVTDSSRIRSMAVAAVAKGSPADIAGLKPHDQVLRIDGLAITGYTIGALKGIREKEKGDWAQFVVKEPPSKAERTIDVVVGARAPSAK